MWTSDTSDRPTSSQAGSLMHSSIRTGSVPPGVSDGTTNRTPRGEAATTRASAAPTSTCGSPSGGSGRWVPVTDTRPPGSARRGLTARPAGAFRATARGVTRERPVPGR